MKRPSKNRCLRLAAGTLLLCFGLSTAMGETLVLQGELFKTSPMRHWDRGTTLETVRTPWLYALEHRFSNLTLKLSEVAIPAQDKLSTQGIQGDGALLQDVTHLQALWASGQFADLTQTQAAALLQDMHPKVRDMVTYGGRIFGIPVGLAPQEALTVSREGLEAAGLTLGELPTTFPALLDFLGSWESPSGLRPLDTEKDGGDAVLFLGKLLVRTCRLLEAETGMPTDWAGEEMAELFQRCREVGKKLNSQRAEKDAIALFARTAGDPRALPHALPLRLREDDPGLVPVSVDVLVLRSDVQARQEAEAFLLCYIERIATRPESPYTPSTYSQWEHDADVAHALLYATADREVLCDAPFSYPATANAIAYMERMLEQSALPDANRQEIAEALPFLRNALPDLAAKHLYFSTDDLAAYQQLAPYLCDGHGASLSNDVGKALQGWAQGSIGDSQLGKKLQQLLV